METRKNICHIERVRIFNGEIPKGLFVLHKCDNRKCCNPKHLFVGTHSDNMQDMIKKGRRNYPRGVLCKSSKINENIALEIRQLASEGVKHTKIALKYGLSHSHVSAIVRNEIWVEKLKRSDLSH